MSKYIIIYMVVLAALALSAIDLLTSEPGAPVSAFAFVENEHETNMRLAAHQRFSAVLQPAIRDLADGRIPLREASADVYAAAQAHSPIYLTMLGEPGNCVEERIANNLIGHIEDLLEAEKRDPARLQSLRTELDEMSIR